jgi:outer membrane immunogenic protein
MSAKSNTGTPFAPSGTPINGETKWMNGWTVGAGVEFAIADRWTIKAEYMHFDLGSAQFIEGPTPVNVDVKGDSVRLGTSFHFNQVQREVSLK